MENWGILPTECNRAGRMLLAGRLTATVVSGKTGQHITVRFKSKIKDEEAGKWVNSPFAKATHVFIDTPMPDSSWGDKIGTYYPDKGTFWQDKNADVARIFAARQVLLFAGGLSLHPQVAEIKIASSCGRCGRQLTDPVSIDRGIGPECYGADTGSQHQHKGEQQALEQAVREEYVSTGNWAEALDNVLNKEVIA